MHWKLTRLDSSGEAKLSNSTLTFTVRVPGNEEVMKRICYFSKIGFGELGHGIY